MAYDFKVTPTVNGEPVITGNHNHDGDYAPDDHDHSGVYSEPGHSHDYAGTNHDHSGVYSEPGHTHDYAGSTHDHAGYAQLAGRNGGQSLSGGTAAGDDLTLDSTINGTKGHISLQPSGGNVVIGSSVAPTSMLVVNADIAGHAAAKFINVNEAGYGVLISGGHGSGYPLWVRDHTDADAFIVYDNGNIYATGDCSALTFTDRTAGYEGDALSDLSKIKSTKKDGLDHSTLPLDAKKKIDKGDGTLEDGRDLGMMVTILTKAFREQMAINAALVARLDALEKKA